MSEMEKQSYGDKELQGSSSSKNPGIKDFMRKHFEEAGLVGRTTHDIHSDIIKTVTGMRELANHEEMKASPHNDTPTSGDQQSQEIQIIPEGQSPQDEKFKVTSGNKKTLAEMREAADRTIILANNLAAERENQPHHRFALTEEQRAENDRRKDLKRQLEDLSSSSEQEFKTSWEKTERAQHLRRVMDEDLTNSQSGNPLPSKIFKKGENPPLNTSERDSSLRESLRNANSPYGSPGDEAITRTLDFLIQDKLKHIEDRVGRAGDAAFPYSLWQAGLDSDPQTGKANQYLKGDFDTMKKKAHKLLKGNSFIERFKLLRQLHADETEIDRRTNS